MRTRSTSVPSTPATGQPANRAERRAAARGRDRPEHAGGPSAPRTSGPGVQAKPTHTRPDFAARKSG